MARRRRLTPARSFQPKDDPIRLLAEHAEPRIAEAMKAALLQLREIVPVKAIEEAIARGQGSKAAHLVDWKSAERALKIPIGLMGRVYEVAAHHGGQQIDNHLKRGRKKGLRYVHKDNRREVQAIVDESLAANADARFAFDRFDPRTQERLRDLVDDLVGDLSDNARETINAVVIGGLRAGDSAADIAANIRSTISLNPTQAEHVASYRRDLEELEPKALKRALRDAAHDDLLQDAIDSGEFLTDAQIERMVDSYLDNYLDHRAESIARTESLRAANAGILEGYKQAHESGAIPEEAVTRQWLIELDEATCPICLSIVENNPNGVGLNESFQSDDGPIDDPPVHPNCRCTVQYVTNLDLVPDREEEEA